MTKFDLEKRTFTFAKDIRLLVRRISKSTILEEDLKQLIRSSGSIGANYREANDALSKKDFIYRIRISRKEAKESKYWLQLIFETNPSIEDQGLDKLIQEADELKLILSKILQNCT